MRTYIKGKRKFGILIGALVLALIGQAGYIWSVFIGLNTFVTFGCYPVRR
jgi:hypothetical protein